MKIYIDEFSAPNFQNQQSHFTSEDAIIVAPGIKLLLSGCSFNLYVI